MKKILLFALLTGLVGVNPTKASQNNPRIYQETYKETIKKGKESLRLDEEIVIKRNRFLERQGENRDTKIRCTVAGLFSVFFIGITAQSFMSFKASPNIADFLRILCGLEFSYLSVRELVAELNTNK